MVPYPTRQQLISVLTGMGLGLTLMALILSVNFAYQHFLMDLQVFQDAGFAFVRNQPLYDGFQPRSGFAFIYPPFAALLMAPMSVFGARPLEVTWNLGQVLSVWAILYAGFIMLQRDGQQLHHSSKQQHTLAQPQRRLAAWNAVVLLGIGLYLEPVRNGLAFGQIDLLLAALVVLDLAGVLPRWARGMGIGIAAGIKITPAAFALVYILRKDFRPVLVAIATTLATIAIGFAVRPQDSWLFWTEKVFDTNRAGGKDFFKNQAFSGLLSRNLLPADSTPFVIVWAAVVLVLFVLGVRALILLERRGESLYALGLFALMVVVLQPYAVTHHWAILTILLPVTAKAFAEGHRYRWYMAAFIAVQMWGPSWMLNPDRGVPAFFAAFGEIQAVTALLALCAAIVMVLRGTDEHADHKGRVLLEGV